MEWMGLMMECCGAAVKKMGILRVNMKNMKALIVKMEIVTLTGQGR
jgi:hypothetical protein